MVLWLNQEGLTKLLQEGCSVHSTDSLQTCDVTVNFIVMSCYVSKRSCQSKERPLVAVWDWLVQCGLKLYWWLLVIPDQYKLYWWLLVIPHLYKLYWWLLVIPHQYKLYWWLLVIPHQYKLYNGWMKKDWLVQCGLTLYWWLLITPYHSDRRREQYYIAPPCCVQSLLIQYHTRTTKDGIV